MLSQILSLACLAAIAKQTTAQGMFRRTSDEWGLSGIPTTQLNYGVAVTDVDLDKKFDFVIAGFGGPNIVLKYDRSLGRLVNIAQEDTPYAALRDKDGAAIGVAACDIDGDGKEEIYFLNTNGAYGGQSTYKDKLFKFRNGMYVDLFSDPVNSALGAVNFAGRSVACVDRYGTGKYAFVLAAYSNGNMGEFAMIEMDEQHPQNDKTTGMIVLRNVAKEAGIDKQTGGRGVTVGPIVTDRSDMFFVNEGGNFGNKGDNFLFRNMGNGMFMDVAPMVGVTDSDTNGRGVALSDFNHDGMLDIVYGNWNGPHRLFMQSNATGMPSFMNVAKGTFEDPTAIRTMIAADFDNDGDVEVLQNNIYYNGPQPNKLFRVSPTGAGMNIAQLDIGDALEYYGFGTGGAVTDLDGDGQLELLLSHGESSRQPLEIYNVTMGSDRNWMRVHAYTRYGAPARGAKITVVVEDGTTRTRILDAGSGYLCQMEPVAHIGLGMKKGVQCRIQWPDGKVLVLPLGDKDQMAPHYVPYPVEEGEEGIPEPEPGMGSMPEPSPEPGYMGGDGNSMGDGYSTPEPGYMGGNLGSGSSNMGSGYSTPEPGYMGGNMGSGYSTPEPGYMGGNMGSGSSNVGSGSSNMGSGYSTPEPGYMGGNMGSGYSTPEPGYTGGNMGSGSNNMGSGYATPEPGYTGGNMGSGSSNVGSGSNNMGSGYSTPEPDYMGGNMGSGSSNVGSGSSNVGSGSGLYVGDKEGMKNEGDVQTNNGNYNTQQGAGMYTIGTGYMLNPAMSAGMYNRWYSGRCSFYRTAWSTCSVTCGTGKSWRSSNYNFGCVMQRESRTCVMPACPVPQTYYYGACGTSMFGYQTIALDGCPNVRYVGMRTCNQCANTMCCVPVSRLAPLRYMCDDGTLKTKMVSLRQYCQCWC
ncbi:cartilage acidic protein 1 isoform X2 [Lingula anatina]|uniref:Cartilage acidic protein 1 isoform X1 n=1 Tax=Lingula anatina TaxID=7574 RepID=A0A1S3J042_LINAN|nr:cartilage acidic protein 1 isoform X1 [Lingula anatina]XP_013403816.1 cartilage acidic protein 1 isoform X2 [Lingula anatina]|eukprot:XP_013403815.1 cartilage acidic protein 1 isoform X1 [Lingula anatina]